MAQKLISIDEARARILAEAAPLAAEIRLLTEVLGTVLAEDITAQDDVPPFDNSAMDGFAVMTADTVDATTDSPVQLNIVHTIPAGLFLTEPLRSGQAAKIMTGAPLPEGADSVVERELVEETAGEILLVEPARLGKNIRRAGEDVAEGDRVLASGVSIGPPEIGLLASMGRLSVSVHRRPRVAIVSTGSELVEVGRPLERGKIYDSNSHSLKAMCAQLGIEADTLGIVPDDYEATGRTIGSGLDYDVLITSGGVSVGQFDFVKEVQDALGVERRLWGVAMKPGKPLSFGVRENCLVFGLPGNPVSALVSFELFVRPALLRLMGHKWTSRPPYRAIMSEDASNSDGRTYVIRVRAWREEGIWHVSATGPQGSGMLRSMVGANGLAFIPGGPRGIRAGEEVDFLLLREDLQEP